VRGGERAPSTDCGVALLGPSGGRARLSPCRPSLLPRARLGCLVCSPLCHLGAPATPLLP